jgi:hypothetical protein
MGPWKKNVPEVASVIGLQEYFTCSWGSLGTADPLTYHFQSSIKPYSLWIARF